MRFTVLVRSTAVALFALLPALATAAGSMQSPRNEDFRELIVKGERPEIAACLATAIEYARHNSAISAIRWDDDASDRALMRESENGGRLTRHVRIATQMRMKKWNLFMEAWRSMDVLCEQTEDGTVHLTVRPSAH
ncbi:MAG TPA: hypothetical protein VED83_05540 [Burkholderiaceae bacterium]|nr:hypothetical protein [Burkholderiaceae bacterium]